MMSSSNVVYKYKKLYVCKAIDSYYVKKCCFATNDYTVYEPFYKTIDEAIIALKEISVMESI